MRARRLFSINGLFVRFTVLVSWATGDGEAVDAGDAGATTGCGLLFPLCFSWQR